MPTPISSLLGTARRATYVLTASDAAFPIPTWAQGGKGIVYVTGCGGGGSGRITVQSGQRGEGGGAAGFAVGHPIVIPTGVSTCAVVIGAGAAGTVQSGSTALNGLGGGETTLTIGARVLRLEGGLAGGLNPVSAGAPSRGIAYMGATSGSLPRADTQSGFGNVGSSDTDGAWGLQHAASTLGTGARGGRGDAIQGGFGCGGQSLFGEAAPGLGVGPTATTNGVDATGYGAGGSGALRVSVGTAVSGAGSPGFLILEFVEGL